MKGEEEVNGVGPMHNTSVDNDDDEQDDDQCVPLVVKKDNKEDGGARSILEVVAPADLNEGYKFETKLNDGSGRMVEVKVPAGGIQKGQTFHVEIDSTNNNNLVEEDDRRGISSHVITVPTAVDGDDLDTDSPIGHWKDGLCNCLSVGLIHPMLCNAYFCPIVLTAQIMHRLRLNWIASPVSDTKVHHSRQLNTFRIVVGFYGFVLCCNIIMALMLGHVSHNIDNDNTGDSYYNANTGELMLNPILITTLQFVQGFNYITALYSLGIMIRTRYYLRKKYMIPTSGILPCCPGCFEDCCTIYFCNCCALSQMARHTANYDRYPATCCTETGLVRNV